MEIMKDLDRKTCSRNTKYQFYDFFPSYFDGKVFWKLVVGAASYVFRSRQHRMTSHTFTLLLALEQLIYNEQTGRQDRLSAIIHLPHFPLNISHSIHIWFVFQSFLQKKKGPRY